MASNATQDIAGVIPCTPYAYRGPPFVCQLITAPVLGSIALIELIVSHFEPYSDRCSNTIRTARSRTSVEYCCGFSISHFLK